MPAEIAPSSIDRARGCLVGLAVGDALGTTLEFRTRDSQPPVDDLVGGGIFKLAPGQWTDDTAMALALADSLLHDPDLDAQDLLSRFLRWMDDGEYSCTGTCFDVGIATRNSLEQFRVRGTLQALDPNAAGNGSLMRLAPVAILHHRDERQLRRVARDQSLTTHGSEIAADACELWALVLTDALKGLPRDAVLRTRDEAWSPLVKAIDAGAWRGKSRASVRSGGFVVETLDAAYWCVSQACDFREAVTLAANLGDDADTTAAVTGQLAGALWGESGIPAAWRERVAWGERLGKTAERLFGGS